MENLWIWLLVIAAILLLVLYLRHRKHLNYNNLTLITGGVKAGKTTLAVALSVKKYEKSLRRWEFRDRLCRFFKKENHVEKPLFYSNIPVLLMHKGKKIGYVPLTMDLLTRQKRFAYGSVILISESSLVADSFDIKEREFNESLTLFNKLIAHETLGGYLFYETQSLSDNHFAVKRCLDKYVWINHCYKLPFILAYDVREMCYSYDNQNVQNVFTSDVDDTKKFVFISKKWWKRFDSYCYSALTDGKEVVTDTVIPDTFKCDEVLSFRGIKK